MASKLSDEDKSLYDGEFDIFSKAEFQVIWLHMACQIFEDFICVTPHIPVTGEIGQIRVDASGDRVVIAGADMCIGYQLAMFTPHNKRHFKMDFQIGQAISNLHPSTAKRPRQLNVIALIKPCL